MANRTATLYIRITKNGKSSFCKPVYLSKGRLKPQYAMIKGEPEHHDEGVYYVRLGTDGGKQQFVQVGKDPFVALDKLEEKKRWLRDRERQVVPLTPVNAKLSSNKLSMDDAVAQYFKNLHSQGKDPKTIRAYKVAVEEFRKSCTKKFLNEIGRQDLIDFMGWLRKQTPKLRKDGTPRKPRRSGDPNRTYFNKVNNVVIFLSAHGINRLLKKSEYPKFAEKPVVYYEAEQVKALYSAAKDDEERFTLDYFLKSGVRDGEAAHAEYSDVKGGFLNIVDKPHLNWHPKHWHIRRIPIPQDLVAAIAERQRKNPNSTLIFPNGAGNPDEHLLRIVQRVAKNAGDTFHADLHTFRRTSAQQQQAAHLANNPNPNNRRRAMLKKRAPKPHQICEENWGGPCRGGCGNYITGQFTCNDCKKKKAETNFTLNPGEVELWRGAVSTKDKDGEQLMMTRQVVMRRATSIRPRPQEWLWQDRIPKGAITWIVGQPGNAKSLLTIEITAAATTGKDWPDGSKNTNGSMKVLMFCGEDDLATTVIPRLMAAGANLENVGFLDNKAFRGTVGESKVPGRSIDLSQDMETMMQIIKANPDFKLLICDPITGIFGSKKITKDEEVNPTVLHVAEELGMDCVGVDIDPEACEIAKKSTADQRSAAHRFTPATV